MLEIAIHRHLDRGGIAGHRNGSDTYRYRLCPPPQPWRMRANTELDNLRAAFQWFLAHQPAQALALTGALKDFWGLRGYYQKGRQWWSQALASHDAPASQSVLRLTVLEAIADLYFLQDEWVQAITGYEEAIALWPQTASDKLTKVRLLRKLGETVSAGVLVVHLEPYFELAHVALQEGVRLMADEPPHVETVLLLVGLSLQCWRERAIFARNAGTRTSLGHN